MSPNFTDWESEADSVLFILGVVWRRGSPHSANYFHHPLTHTLLQRSWLGVEREILLTSKWIMLRVVPWRKGKSLQSWERVCPQNLFLWTSFGSGPWGSRIEITLVPWLIWKFYVIDTWLTKALWYCQSAINWRGPHFVYGTGGRELPFATISASRTLFLRFSIHHKHHQTAHLYVLFSNENIINYICSVLYLVAAWIF